MYENSFRGMQQQPSNNLWVGNNYSSGYSQMSRNNYANQQMPQSINNVLQVMGPESAQAYQIGPNSHVILIDSTRPVIYTKRSDDSGYSITEAYSIKKIPLFQEIEEPAQISNVNYVTQEEFNEFKNMIEELVMKNE